MNIFPNKTQCLKIVKIISLIFHVKNDDFSNPKLISAKVTFGAKIQKNETFYAIFTHCGVHIWYNEAADKNDNSILRASKQYHNGKLGGYINCFSLS